MGNLTINKGNVVEWAKAWEGPKFHGLLCDPPYHLSSIVERYGDPDSAPAKGGVYNRSSTGFMGRQWDGGNVAFDPATWAAIWNILEPGAFCFAFASTRGVHRMAIAIEDGGFILHPTIFAWGFGSGFPKATRIDTQIDRAAGVERQKKRLPKSAVRNQKSIEGGHGIAGGDRPFIQRAQEIGYHETDAGIPVTPDAIKWLDYRYGGQVLKPALEPIICFQKPYPKGVKTWKSINSSGAGALNIEAGRIEAAGSATPNRWPAGLALTHHPHCTPALCVDDCPVRTIKLQGGPPTSKGSANRVIKKRSTKRSPEIDFDMGESGGNYAMDGGTVDRYFYNADWQMENEESADSPLFAAVRSQIEAADSLLYTTKPDRKERDAGLSNAAAARSDARPNSPDPTGKFPEHSATMSRNPHPTVKPIALSAWLASLLLPPPEYEPRLLVPFSGVASEMIGAYKAGWNHIVGVELDEDDTYIPVARQRLTYWQRKIDAERALTLKAKAEPLPLKFAQESVKQLDFSSILTRPCSRSRSMNNVVLITGSRDPCYWQMAAKVHQIVKAVIALDYWFPSLFGATLIFGDAVGVDAYACQYARRYGVSYQCYGYSDRPHNPFVELGRFTDVWGKPYAKYAPAYRDKEMVKLATRCVAVWNGESKGTIITHDAAKHAGLPTKLIEFNSRGLVTRYAPSNLTP